jgi:hypothetical protein
MRFLPFALVALGACSQPAPPPARAPAERAKDDAAAVTALREARFDDAAREATAVLARSPRDPEAAAVRAIATYQGAGSTLVTEIEAVMHEADTLQMFDHERGRAAWQGFLTKLDAVDADLAIAAAEPTFSLELCIACWEHDWNRNGRVDERDRKLLEIEIDEKGEDLPEGDPRRRPTFRFDVGDADWARAMIAFQRAGVELVLAYKWSELDKLFNGHDGRDEKLVIHLSDAHRVQRARELVLAGVGFADRCREEYLAETDDDREWVPNPRQKSHAVPLEVDGALYETWAATTGDVRRLLSSEEGISLRELGDAVEHHLGRYMPDAYIDVGRMLREPTDIVIDLSRENDKESPELYAHVLKGLLGHGYATGMKSSALVRRLERMKRDLEHGDDTLGRKLRYLFWLN